MKPEAQQRAIAEACGKSVSCAPDPYNDTPEHHDWREWEHQDKPFPFRFRTCKRCQVIHIEGERYVSIDSDNVTPYYLNLNAMHEAENMLTREQQDKYVNKHLYDLLPCDENHGPCDGDSGEDIIIASQYQIAHATAAQRAEAFLRTIGKWVESSNPKAESQTL